MMKVIYIGLLLDAESHMALAALAEEGHVVYADHVTIAFGDAVTPDHLAMVGQEMTVAAKAMVRTNELVCVELGDVAGCCNKHPHVTVSCAQGVRPVASNGVLEAPHPEQPYPLSLHVTVGWFGFLDDEEKPSWHFGNVPA